MKYRFLALAALMLCLFTPRAFAEGPVYGAPGDTVSQGIAWVGNKIADGVSYLFHRIVD